MDKDICARCGTERLQDLRTWTFIKTIERHICPICVLQGAQEEDPNVWGECIQEIGL